MEEWEKGKAQTKIKKTKSLKVIMKNGKNENIGKYELEKGKYLNERIKE